MKLNHLTDAALLIDTENLARAEQELLLKVLHHLREIDRRRLFSALEFPSLFAYAVGRLKYSEDQAHRRIQAMRTLRELPEIEEKIEGGSLNLTQIGIAKAAFNRQKFTHEEKLDLLKNIEGKSTRESEAIILGAAPLPEKPERVRAASPDTFTVQFTASAELMHKIEILRGRYAHTDPGMSLAELFAKLCELGLDATNKETKPGSPKSREVFTQAHSQCQNCKGTYALQEDHRIAKAMGGSDGLENLRLLCRHCNQRAAIEIYGVDKMEKYLFTRGAAGKPPTSSASLFPAHPSAPSPKPAPGP